MLNEFIQNDWLLKAVQVFLLLLLGILIIRLGGKKSISQMTFPTFVVTLAIGTVLAQPIGTLKEGVTLYAISMMILFLVVLEALSIKFDWLEKIFVGESVLLVENGQVNKKNLKKARVSLDQLKADLRLEKIKNISDCRSVTLEPNGKIGIELKKSVSPITYQECSELIDKKLGKLLDNIDSALSVNPCNEIYPTNLFDEVKGKKSEEISDEDLK